MKLHIDPQQITSKPPKHKFKEINNRIVENVQEFEGPSEVYDLITNGCAIVPCRLKEINGQRRRRKENWAGQRLFLLDFDNEELIGKGKNRKKVRVPDDRIVTPEIIKARCEDHGLSPSFGYYSLSSTSDHPKFRVIFDAGFEIFSGYIRDLFQISLMKTFPECDPQCKDRTRVFYGSRPGSEAWELVDYEATQDLIPIIQAVVSIIKSDRNNNSTRDLRYYYRETGLTRGHQGYPEIINIEAPELITKSDYFVGNPLLYNKELLTLSSDPDKGSADHRGLVYGPNQKQWYSIDFSKPRKVTRDGVIHYNDKKTDRKRTLMEIPLDDIREHCPLFTDLCQGVETDHHERFHLACNICRVKGGTQKLMDLIIPDERYSSDWSRQLPSIAASYNPTRCDPDRCPYYGEQCESAGNILDTSRRGRGRVKIYEKHEAITIEEMDRQLGEIINYTVYPDDLDLENPEKYSDKDIHVIKAPTGSGKTERYLGLVDKSAIIALPTHWLAREVHQRMLTHAAIEGIRADVTLTPQLPDLGDPDLNNKIKMLYAAGAYPDAHTEIRKVADDGNKTASKYLTDLAHSLSSSGCLLTTHERLMYYRGSNRGICIIDEDPMASICKEDRVTVDDITRLRLALDPQKHDSEQVRLINDLYAQIIDTPVNTVIRQRGRVVHGTTRDISQAIINNNIKGNVLGLIRSQLYIRHEVYGEHVVSFVNRRDLPENMRVVILSATADRKQYERLAGSRLHWHEIGPVEHTGKIIQYTNNSMSRQGLSHNTSHLDIARAIAGDQNVITFAKYEHHFSNPVAHYGACSGIDHLKGQNLCVVGTPHLSPISYVLRASALGEESLVITDGMTNIPVRHNGMQFYFNTPDASEFIQHVQLAMIESELIQAIGRARALRENCTVTVLSNLPIPGFEYRYLTRSEKDEILADYCEKQEKTVEKDVA